jgi:hypothetical protein
MLRTEVLECSADVEVLLPPRLGSRPTTPVALPHIQLDQWPPAAIAEKLIERSLSLDDVRSKQSRMASPKCRALWLPDRCAGGPRDAFIDGHEFCHLHPLPEGSIHLTLPNPLRDQVVELGWAEQHPVVRVGVMPETLVLVYAPRDRTELAVAFHLIWSSWQFARGV